VRLAADSEFEPSTSTISLMTTWTEARSSAGQRYLLLADISGYTAFLTSVEQAHGVDFSAGIPAGYAVLAALLDGVVEDVQPDFEIAKLEGDAVFADAPADTLDGQGAAVLRLLLTAYANFRTRRTEARTARDHVCTACPVVSSLDLKMVLHRGLVVRQVVGAHPELLGPAVNVTHRLLKNSVQARIGYRPYTFVTDEAASALGLSRVGIEHREEYPDVGPVQGRIIELAESPAPPST
jgi:class 3 adenylate cyclase